MKLSYLTNLALVVLVLLLFWLNKQPEIEKQTAQTVANNNAESINSITINRSGRPTIELQKVGSIWQLTKPIKAAANETRIALLLNILQHSAQQKLTIDSSVNLAKFGLNTPQYSLLLNELQFDFGDPSPIQKGRYVKHGNVIYVIDDSIAHLINSSATAFIDNRLINKSDKLVKLELPNATFELVDGHWQSNSELSQDKMLEIVESWQHAQALQVLTKSETIQKANVTLWFENQKQPLQLAMQLDQQNLSLYDIDAQLNYQFTSNFSDALFLTDTINSSQD